jgi:hypothetical protein
LEMFWFEYEQKKISVCNNSHFFTAEGETWKDLYLLSFHLLAR